MRLARFARVRLVRHALPISLPILRKKPTVLQSNYDSATVNISFFIQPKKNFFSEWYFPKNHGIGGLVVRKVKQAIGVTAF